MTGVTLSNVIKKCICRLTTRKALLLHAPHQHDNAVQPIDSGDGHRQINGISKLFQNWGKINLSKSQIGHKNVCYRKEMHKKTELQNNRDVGIGMIDATK